MFDDQTNAVGNATTIDNAELVVWCRNHADALADLIDAASALAEPAGWWRGVEQRQSTSCLTAGPSSVTPSPLEADQ